MSNEFLFLFLNLLSRFLNLHSKEVALYCLFLVTLEVIGSSRGIVRQKRRILRDLGSHPLKLSARQAILATLQASPGPETSTTSASPEARN